LAVCSSSETASAGARLSSEVVIRDALTDAAEVEYQRPVIDLSDSLRRD
jgi:hypothetical protein